MTIIQTNFLSIPEYAKLIGVTPSYVRQMIHAGRLVHARTGNVYLVPADAEIQAAPRPIGRPSKIIRRSQT